MKEHSYGVVTGDIVGSTEININYYEILESIRHEIANQKAQEFEIEFYRGDSFQCIIEQPELGLFFMLLLKSGLRSHPIIKNSNKAENGLDARMSLGIGDIKGGINHNKPIGEMDGQAFIRSGRQLETMKESNLMLKITTGDEKLDDEFNAVCPLLTALTNKWSINQAEAVYLYLLGDLTQKEIGKILGISQRGAGKRLDTSNIEEIMHYNKRFKNLIQWNFNN